MTGHWNEVGWPEHMADDDDDTRQAKVKELHLLKTDLFMKLIDEKVIPLRTGVLRIIDEAIVNGVRLAVCSTSNEKAVQNIVTTLMTEDQAEQFQVFAGDMVKKKKPAPDVYNMACEEMGLDKSRCVVIEDSHIGLSAAKAAGIACIVTKSSYTDGEDFTAADMVVDELGDEGESGVTLETLIGLINQTLNINYDVGMKSFHSAFNNTVLPQKPERYIGISMTFICASKKTFSRDSKQKTMIEIEQDKVLYFIQFEKYS